MRKRILAGNWKMNKDASGIQSYFTELNQHVKCGLTTASQALDVVIAAPYTLLSPTALVCRSLGVKIAAQNVHWEMAGAFTGEVSPTQLLDVGTTWTLIGHSERRQYFAETNLTVEKKVRSALLAGLKVIACVGETLEERKSSATVKIVTEQVATILSGAAGKFENLTIAYEPVWAIGTGLAATAAEAQETHGVIRNLIRNRASAEVGSAMRILYGGSMNPKNTTELLAMEDIDGGLIGGASLKPQEFGEMINLALS